MVILAVLIVSVVVVGTVGLAVAAQLSSPPDTLGVQGGQLAPCPDSPNCVSTQSTSDTHRIDPIPFTASPEQAQQRLLEIIRSLERATIVTDTPGYVHVEFRSRFFRFVDDAEFFVDQDAGVIHARSAARLGYSDMGVNRERIQMIAERFAANNVN